MPQKTATLYLFFLIIFSSLSHAQSVKFGKVSKEELQEKFYPLDSSANAAILYKKRRTYYDYNQQTGWTLITKVHERIKIYNKDGNDWATKKINLYDSGSTKEKVSIKASTYNLVGNKIEKTKLKNSDIFNEDINKYWSRSKFTMPNLNEGSVIEWEYAIRSPYIQNIDDMVFQYKIPLKYIDTQVEVPEFFVFKNQSKGYFPVNLKKNTKRSQINITSKNRSNPSPGTNYSASTSFSQDKIEYTSNISQCIQENIPALIEEPYTNNIDNYTTSLKYELSAYRPKNDIPKFYNTTWDNVTKTIYESSNFGEQLKKSSHFKDDLVAIISSSSSQNEQIIKIFQFVKSKMKWDNFRGKYTDKGVKKAYKEGVGNAAEINLTLVAMLRGAGIKANPILISTRDNGIPLFPTTQGFNYVIAGVELKNGTLLLDATEKHAPPNVLPLRALNWQGRIVRKDGSSAQINLSPKKYSTKKAYLNVKLNEDAIVTGSCRAMFSELIALDHRNKYNGVNNQDLIGKLEKENQNIEISELKVSNEEDISKALTHTFAFETDNQVEIIGEKMYFSPLLFLTEKENPFKLENRTYPVDFGAPFEEKYTVSIQIPEGYTVESKPENAGYGLPDKMGTFQFATILKGDKLQILASTKMNYPVISPVYYASLKQFYKKMIDKQLEKVVLSKI